MGCDKNYDRHKKAIEFITNDSTLIDTLYEYTGRGKDLKKKDYSYKVYKQQLNDVLSTEAGACLDELNINSAVRTELAKIPTNSIDTSLVRYSTSDSAKIHFFFTKQVSDLMAVSVIHQDPTSYSNFEERALTFLWRYNTAIHYFFKFHEYSDQIDNVCQSIAIYD